MNQVISIWTDEDKAKVRDLAASGLSASKIAAEFEGRSRNAVIGLVHRIGINLKNPSGFAEGNSRGKPARKPKAKPSAALWGSMSVDEKSASSISIAAQRKKNVRGGVPKSIPVSYQEPRVEGEGQAGAVHEIRREEGSHPRLPSDRAENKPGAPAVIAGAPISRMVPLLDLKASDCRWPVGDPKDEGFGFCGHRRASGSYCEHHHLLSTWGYRNADAA